MQEQELRAVLADNIKKYRTKRGGSQLILSEKLNISANFLSEIETGKGWVSPLTLVKLASALDVEVFELFVPLSSQNTAPDSIEARKMRRFAKDLSHWTFPPPKPLKSFRIPWQRYAGSIWNKDRIRMRRPI